ncbi:indole-3-glycerol phosphate synthase TrpC [Chloroflexota bacterium]
MPTILDEIICWKRSEIERCTAALPAHAVQVEAAQASDPRDFAAALSQSGVSLIAEVKKASPSKGLLRPHLDPVALAREYEACGASAVSVLTDEHFFQGSLDHLRAVRRSINLPVLCKDFVLDPYQVYRARASGADAILLIVAALSDGDLRSLYQLVRELGMAALVEVHNAVQLEQALRIDPRIIGVNNRNLRTFEVNLETTARLRPLVADSVILVAESGIKTRADVEWLATIGADAILVGEVLVRAADVGYKVRELVGRP